LIAIIEGLETKPYLLGDVGYASCNYILCNFKPIGGNMDKIRFD
jgi:hypothetical protein